ncbi:MAG: phosphoribosyl-AMP cyclohydrolase [Rhodospirillaceae bacterium]|nr:phosphoribosyl-AMP cyclohydrolase [Rhodospirillaceae bacterium]|tara:strand:- start:678 stop:1151 length:474 start_codon:yes stop_codon:yes gene_type:complete
MNNSLFKDRVSVEQVEESSDLAPSFGDQGLIPVVTTDVHSGDVLMVGYMNKDAFALTIETKKAHYWSRSRNKIWKKGETSGLVQNVIELRIDDDQDSLWLKVDVEGSGASCHVGYKSCFYRSVPLGGNENISLDFKEKEKTFDPKKIYGEIPNPTKL